MPDRNITAVLFDYGGVLTTPLHVSTGQWLLADRIEPDSFHTVMREWLGRDAAAGNPVHQLETGELSGPDFERELAARLRRVDGRPVLAQGLLDRLFAGMRPDPAMPELLHSLSRGGVNVGLLSNSWGNTYPPEVYQWCDPVVISGEVRLRKPDPRIYQLALDRLDIQPANCVFIDDAPVNVAAATEIGMVALRHRDAATTRAALQDLLPNLSEVSA